MAQVSSSQRSSKRSSSQWSSKRSSSQRGAVSRRANLCSESKAARLTGSKRPVSSIKQRTGEESDSDNEFFASDDDANFGLALSPFLVGSKSSDKKKKHKQKHDVQEQPGGRHLACSLMSMRALREECVSAPPASIAQYPFHDD